MSRSRVLITGFGPFPGVTDNVSGRLARSLARSELSGRARMTHAELLPTEWEEVSSRAPRLLDEVKPRLIVHFGLSCLAEDFRIERSAYNRAAPRQDARGALPRSRTIRASGPARIDTCLPTAELAKHLRQHDLPARTSRSAGRYLCNFLYYLSLDRAARQDTACDVCFVHVPPATALSETELLRGSKLILCYLLDHIGAREAADQRLAAMESASARAG
jgi:pyroglutamyl-peptidase